MTFHFIIFSRLQSYDGGRESWINMFLPLLNKKLSRSIINVYYFCDEHSDENRLISIYDDSKFNFYAIPLPSVTSKLKSIFRLYYFTKSVITLIKTNISLDKNTKNVLVSIGSFREALVLKVFHIIYGRKNILSIIWLRSIWAKEIFSKHSGLVYKNILRFEKIFLKSADKIIANGFDTAKFYKNIGVESHVITNAIDLSQYKHMNQINNDDKIIISYIGRLSREKGILDYLDSIKMFNERFEHITNKVVFEIVGDGPLKKEVLNLNYKNTIFRGPIENKKIIDYLNRITIGVALTYSNSGSGGGGVSNGLLELMASARLIVCWDNLIFKQVLDSSSAIMIEESNVQELARNYAKVINNFDNFVTKSKTAKMISFNYSKENHIDKFIEIIN